MERLFSQNELDQLLAEKDYKEIARRISEEHPADVAEVLEDLEPDVQQTIFNLLDIHTGASALSELDSEDREELLESIDTDQLTHIVEELPADDAADIVGELPEDKAEHVLRRLEPEDSAELQEILSHEEDSASGIMDPELLSVPETSTVGQTLAAIRDLDIDPEEELYYVYVVDYQNHLVGTLTLPKLIKSDESRPVGSIMNRRFVSVFPDTDQEEVAQLVKKYNLAAIPVVDESGELKGRITVDDILDVIEEEATEDFYKLAGFTFSEETRSMLMTAVQRLPWLVVALVGSLVGAFIQKIYQGPLGADNFALFGPFVIVIAAMGGNIGIQSCTTLVRGLATGDVEGKIGAAVLREISIAVMVGLVCALIGGSIAYINAHAWYVSMVVAFSLFIAIMIASTLGALAPATCSKIGIDPTAASGPVVTVTIDVICIAIYFACALLALQLFS
jgi:magnesium transporter